MAWLTDDGTYTFTRNKNLNEKELLTTIMAHVRELKSKYGGRLKLVTYNGENFAGGFDLPFLRTRCIINNVPWDFINTQVFDLFEHMKRFNTQYEDGEITPEKLDSQFTAEQVIDICAILHVRAIKGNKKGNCMNLFAAHQEKAIEFEKFGYKPKIEAGRKLDYLYAAFGGPALGYEDMSGGDVPQLWLDYLETGDETLIEKLRGYNTSDVIQLKYVFDRCYDKLPKRAKMQGWVDL